MDRGPWWVTVHGVAESDTTQLLTLSRNLLKCKHTRNQSTPEIDIWVGMFFLGLEVYRG